MATRESTFPIGDLERIAGEFRHARAEHTREGKQGSWRRRLGARLDALQEQFDTLLTCWVADPSLQEAWRAHLHEGAAAPGAPVLSPPPWFVGVSDAGSKLEVLPLPEGEYEVRLDGQLDRRLEQAPQLSGGPLATVQLDAQQFTERFTAGTDAVDALAAFAASSAPAPKQWALELLRDGLIDWHFRLTERGQRRLAERRP
jgi:hypothetical protein